jgi:hypothetical protein
LKVIQRITNLCRQDDFHGQNVHFLVNSEWRVHLGSHNFHSGNLMQQVNFPLWFQDTLVGHVTRCTRSGQIRFFVVDGENTVVDGGPNEAVRLTIPTA